MKSIGKRWYVVARKRGRRTSYFYGRRLKEAVALARLREGEDFEYARFDLHNVVNAVLNDGSYVEHRRYS